MLNVLKRRLGRSRPQIPFTARHVEYSAIASADDDPGTASDPLIELALRAAGRARTISMQPVAQRMANPPFYPNIWPGEHYKLLAGLVAEMQPRTVIEIGTSTGLSALAMLETLPKQSRLVTFDIVSWDKFSDTCLERHDFQGGRLSQIIDDVGAAEVMARHQKLFQAADLIFVDGPKDGQFEQTFIDLLNGMSLPGQPILVFDDIRLWNMLAIWRRLAKPKLDITSFGHWSGTGLVQWVGAEPGAA